MNPELEQRIKKSIDVLISSLGNDQENNRAIRLDLQEGLDEVLVELRDIIGEEFNFYPSETKGTCHRIAYFTSLTGARWNLKPSQKLSFKKMFEYLIKHCQGSCAQKTKYAIIVTDTWDDNIADFWKDNIARMYSDGITVQVNIQLIRNISSSYL
jgi:hypothetical protein